MNSISSKLLTVHIVAIIAWMENAQTFFGMLGAFIGFCSAVMLVCINWEKFWISKPMRTLRGLFSNANPPRQ